MSNLFNSISLKVPKQNRFNLSHDVKLTAKFGKLTPILVQDVLPGDVFKLNSEVLVRLAPMVAPIMTRCDVYTHFFFVPKRLVWDNFKDFITGGEDGLQSPSYPRFNLDKAYGQIALQNGLFTTGSLADYLGFPVLTKNQGVPATTNGLLVDLLPFRAYQLIYNEYYRDQNLTDPIEINKDQDGIIQDRATLNNLFTLRNRSWRKDYFTSALPFAQRGDQVELPLGGTAELIFNSDSVPLRGNPIKYASLEADPTKPVNGGFIGTDHTIKSESDSRNVVLGSDMKFTGSGVPDGVYNTTHLTKEALKLLTDRVDLSNATSATINELRRAVRAQEFLEVAARAGSRYIEQIYAYFGVRSSDARLQRPEFLGGGKSPIVISDVLQTSQTTDTSAQATPSGHGISVQNSHQFKFRSEEHGYIIGIMSVMPKAAYCQGLPRMYQKFDRLDHYWPQFAHLGEQEIKNNEIFFSLATPSENYEGTFGYTPRYAEYKVNQDRICGDFRDSLSFWHMGRIFNSPPGLNNEFLTNVQDATDRVFNVVNHDVDKIWVNIHHNLKALRKMPKYGTPML